MTAHSDDHILSLLLSRFDQLEARLDKLVTKAEFDARNELLSSKIAGLEKAQAQHEKDADAEHRKLGEKLKTQQDARVQEAKDSISKRQWQVGIGLTITAIIVSIVFNILNVI